MRRFIFSTTLAVLAGLLPTWALGSDQETAQKIAESIRASGQLKDYSIGVKYEGGKAYLLGRVASPQQAQVAEQLAKQYPDVDTVENRLEITSTSKQDFAVEQAAHHTGNRRTINRDEAVFGAPQPSQNEGSQVSAEESIDAQPVPTSAPSLKPAPTSRRVANNAGVVHSGGMQGGMQGGGRPIPTTVVPGGMAQRAAYDQPQMPCYSWPSYASHPNYAAVTYPNQYSAAAWPYIGPFYPYPQVPLGWRKVTLEWKDGWWFLDFNDHCRTFRR